MIEIEFLLGVAPVFNRYFTMFQSEELLVQCRFDEIKVLLTTILRRVIKVDIVDSYISRRTCSN